MRADLRSRGLLPTAREEVLQNRSPTFVKPHTGRDTEFTPSNQTERKEGRWSRTQNAATRLPSGGGGLG